MTTTARPAISSYVTPETSAGHLTLGRQNAEPQSPRGNPGGGGGSRGHPPTSYSTMPHPRRSQLSSNSNSASTFNARGQPQTNKGGTRLQHSQSQRYSVNYQEEMRRQAYIQSLGKNRGSVRVFLRMIHISIARNHKTTNAIFFPPFPSHFLKRCILPPMDRQISTKVAKDPRVWFGYDDVQQKQLAHNNNAQILSSIFTTTSFYITHPSSSGKFRQILCVKCSFLSSFYNS